MVIVKKLGTLPLQIKGDQMSLLKTLTKQNKQTNKQTNKKITTDYTV